MTTSNFRKYSFILSLLAASNAFICHPSSGAVVFVDSVDREYNFLDVDPSVPFVRDDYDLNGDSVTDFWIDYSQFVFQVVPSGENRVAATGPDPTPGFVPNWSALVMEEGREIGANLGEKLEAEIRDA